MTVTSIGIRRAPGWTWHAWVQRRRLTRLFSITPEVVLGLLGERRGRRYQQRIAPPNRRTGSSFFNLHPTNRRPDGPIGAALARLNHSTATNNNNNNNEGRKKKEKKERAGCVCSDRPSIPSCTPLLFWSYSSPENGQTIAEDAYIYGRFIQSLRIYITAGGAYILIKSHQQMISGRISLPVAAWFPCRP